MSFLSSLDPTSSSSVFGRAASGAGRLGGFVGRNVRSGLTTAAKVPGVSSALTVVTGGAAAVVSPAIRASAMREIETGAAVGGGVLVSRALTPKAPAPAAAPAADTSPGGLDAIDSQAQAASGGSSWWDEGARLVTDRLGGSTTRAAPSGGGEDPLLGLDINTGETPTGRAPSKPSPLLLAGGIGLVLLALVFMLAPRRR